MKKTSLLIIAALAAALTGYSQTISALEVTRDSGGLPVTATLSFAGNGESANFLYVVWGMADRGSEIAQWEHKTFAAVVHPGTESMTLTLPSGAGTDYSFLRFALCSAIVEPVAATELYATNGLMAAWDGIDNAGTGVHDPNASVWTDLTGNGANFPVSTYIGSQLTGWTDTSLKAKSCYNVPCAKSCKNYVSIEICAKHNKQYKCLFNSGDGLNKFVAVKNSTIQFYNAANKNYAIGSDNWLQAAAVHSPTVSSPSVYSRGAAASQTASDTWGTNKSGTCLGRGANTYQFDGEYYAIRLYDRALAANEIKDNAVIDIARFIDRRVSDSYLALAVSDAVAAMSYDMLLIAGEPSAIGSPTPTYGLITGLAANDTRTFSMAATTVVGEGTVTNYLAGWKLESIDSETTERMLIRSSTDANEVLNRCDYVHDGCAAFTWLWDVRDALGVGAPALVANGGNHLTLSAAVSGIGYTAPSATLKIVYGVSPDALTYTNVASASVTGIGNISATLTRLTPGLPYYVKAILETNDAAHDVVESATVCFQTEAIQSGESDPIEALENISGGALASVSLSFDESESARALCAAWGPTYGGNDPAEWYATNAVATVAAGATSATWTPPADWGSDSNLVVRFYFDVASTEWSNPIFWQDYSAPSVTDMAADGTGGDTLVVSGTLASFSGADCTLTAYTGDSPTTLTNAWTGIAGGVRDATGAFSLTLFEPGAASPRYLAPGKTIYVAVVACSGGKVSCTAPVSVTMASSPATFAATPTATVSRRTLSASGRLSDVGMSHLAEVSVWYGTSNTPDDFVKIGESVAITDTEAFSIVRDLPAVNTTYCWQLRAVNTALGDTYCVTSRSSVVSIATRDNTVYTWKAKNGDWSGDWNDPGHWDAVPAADAFGYPNSTYAKAIFPYGHHIEVMVDGEFIVGTLDLSAYDPDNAANGIDVTFRGHEIQEGTVRRRLECSTLLDLNGANGSVVFDNLRVADSGSNATTIGPKRSLTFSGYSYYYKSSSDFRVFYGSQVAFSCATGSVHNLYLGYSGSTLTIDDSPVTYRNECGLSQTSGGGNIVFKGAAPSLYSSAAGANALYAVNNASSRITFHVPAGGYAKPPITCVAKKTKNLFAKNSKTGTITLAIAPESPCFATAGTFDTKLAAWTGSSTSYYIDRSLLAYAALPDGGTFTFGTGSADEAANLTPAASFSGNAQSMGVHIVSAAHDGRITVATDAKAALDGYSPALGVTDGLAGETVTLSAPTDVVSNGVHYVCTGYTLVEYAAGQAATPTATNTVADGTSSFAYAMPAGRAEITWHYATDYPVTATTVNDAGGTITVSAPYMTASSPVTLTASTVTDGMEFQYWYGDLPYESRYANPLTLAADKAASVTAFFGATKENGAVRLATGTGNVSNTSPGIQWFATATWTGGVIPGTNDIAVLRSTSTTTQSNYTDGRYKRRYLAPSFVAVGGLVVSNATLQIGTANAQYTSFSSDQNGVRALTEAVSSDTARREPIGLDVYGDVLLDVYNNSGINCGGTIFVGGKGQRCQSRVEIGGDLNVRNGAIAVAAGYPYVLIHNYNCIPSGVNRVPSLPFMHTNEFFRGGNYLRVKGDTIVRTPSTSAAQNYNLIHVLNDARTGAAVWLDLQDVTVQTGAAITAYQGGYMYFDGSGNVGSGKTYSCSPGGHGSADNYSGGAHGGRGGYGNGTMSGVTRGTFSSSDTIYDFAYSPLFPGNPNVGNGGSRGAGSIRLDCATLTLDGALAATGLSGAKGGAGGGSIWVVCDTFVPGDNCSVKAEGGNLNCGGGGGRIAICEGLSDDQVLALYETHALPSSTTASPLADKLGTRASAAGGVANAKYSPGEDGSDYYIVNTSGKKTLVVAGDPANLGESTPVYGPQVYDEGEIVPAVAPGDAYVSSDNRSKRLCTGFVLADAGTETVVCDSSATSTNLVMDADYNLTWKFSKLVHDVRIEAADGGSITTNAIDDGSSVWQLDGSSLSVTAVPAEGYVFAGWVGEIPEADQYSATFSATVAGPLSIRAVFVSADSDAAAWTGEGGSSDFLDGANWSTGKVPGPSTAVTVGDGATVSMAKGLVLHFTSFTVEAGASVSFLPESTYSTRSKNPRTYPDSVMPYDLHDCGIVASGSITVAGTLAVGLRHSLADARVVAGGAISIAAGASVTVYGGFNGTLIGATGTPALWRNYGAIATAGGAFTVDGTLALYGEYLSGSPVKVSADTLRVGATGAIRANGAGWGWVSQNNVTYDYSLGGISGNNYTGGAYGGHGGTYSTGTARNTRTYGNPLRPYLPGSQGGNNSGVNYGGGALFIDVKGFISNAGVISSNGNSGGSSHGGGSGGSVWIACARLKGLPGSSVTANGGANNSGAGAGGGGRILVCERLTAEQIDDLWNDATAPRKAIVTEITDENVSEFYAGTLTAAGGVSSGSKDVYSGTAGTVRWIRGPELGTILFLQ